MKSMGMGGALAGICALVLAAGCATVADSDAPGIPGGDTWKPFRTVDASFDRAAFLAAVSERWVPPADGTPYVSYCVRSERRVKAFRISWELYYLNLAAGDALEHLAVLQLPSGLFRGATDAENRRLLAAFDALLAGLPENSRAYGGVRDMRDPLAAALDR